MTTKAIVRILSRLLLGGAVAALVSCDEDRPDPASDLTDGLPTFTLRDAGNVCADRDAPGCPCDTEGAHLQCGKVVDRLHDQLICGKGVSVCTLGTWSECALNNSDLSSVPLPSSSGLELQALGAATSCASNPCDPYCVTFLDTTQGLQNTGTNISIDPSGLSTVTVPTSSCTPRTCASQGKNCGPVGDGCGNVLNCGTCAAPQTCGGAGTPSVCGTAVPPGGACVPATCAQLGANCGPAADGCGGLLNCGTCTSPQMCGGAGTPGVCGTPPLSLSCTPTTCASQGMNCGPASDSCGGLLNCGTCTAPQTCGGGGVAGACGPAACVPKTCAQLGKNCGPVSDGCGGLLSCGSCTWPQTCGGAGTPSVCGTNPSCTNLCLQQVTCPAGGTTKVTGTVYAPNGTDPLPNAVVYVPNAAVEAFTTSVSCDNCAEASGSPLVGTTSAVDGKFTLTNVPVGTNIPLVIQIGRWRRQVTIPSVTACGTTAVSASLTRLPRNKTEGDIPKQAFVTGRVDALECVLRKIGVDDSEFTNPIGNGRIHLYAAGAPGHTASSGTANGGSVFGAYKGGVGATALTAMNAGGATEWEHRLLDTHSWLMAASMAYSRTNHAAVLLADGRVLVAGGFGALGTTAVATTSSLNAVEIYDPSTNAWTTRTAMSAQRASHTATVLPSGRVLVTGGVSNTTYYSSAELYNPATNTWGAAGTMTGGVGRARHTATLLNNGKVLVVGGTTNGTAATGTASVYDPAANTWSATANAPTARYYHSATLLANGKVLIAGGTGNGTTALNSAQLYDPATNSFSAAAAMPAVRQQHTDTRLASGKVLLVGGYDPNTSAALSTTAIYDPTANTWAAGPALAQTRRSHAAVRLDDDTVVVFGGTNSAGSTYRTTEETYNPTSNTWSVVGYGYNYAHASHTATKLPNGRVVMAGGSTTGGSFIGYAEVLVNQPLNQYDIALFPCPGAAYYHPSTLQQRYQNNLASFANLGGRVFTTHFTYHWLYNDNATFFSPLSSAVNWNLNQTYTATQQTGYIDQSFAKGALLAQWLKLPAVGASTTLGQIPILEQRRDFSAPTAPTQNWLNVKQSGNNIPVHLTFNTPIAAAAANQCGRVVYSDFHVEDSDNTQFAYPGECSAAAMTPQEKLLEFMMFDLASCVTPDTIPACVPKTCGQLGLNCGQAGDGCGGTLNCGSCTSPQVCGWGSTPNVCTTPVACVPTTCAAQGLTCGPAGNGCGGSLNCGSCTLPQVCGGGGPGQCGIPTSACVPTTCSALNLSCGPAGDGCGGMLDCGSCSAPQTCGGGGQRGQCGSPPACVPKTCSDLGLSCGPAGDGCGGSLNCGSCSAPDTCGGAGQPGQCGHTTIYTTGSFVRDYSMDCPHGTVPVWGLWSWNATTASDSHIDFTVQTAETAAGLASAPSDTLLFSSPPGPTALVDTPASAHAANQPAGTPNTELGAADVDHTLVTNGRSRNNPHVRITSSLVPSSDKKQTALLTSWNLQMSCMPAN